MSYFNAEIPLETALEYIEDPQWRYEIIEDYHAALYPNIHRKILDRIVQTLMEIEE